MSQEQDSLRARIHAVRNRIGEPVRPSILPESVVHLARKGVQTPALLTLAEIALICDAALRFGPPG